MNRTDIKKQLFLYLLYLTTRQAYSSEEFSRFCGYMTFEYTVSLFDFYQTKFAYLLDINSDHIMAPTEVCL